MKNYVPWKWIVTAFVLAVFGIASFGALCSSSHSRFEKNPTNLLDTIKEKDTCISHLQDTLEKKNQDILELRLALDKQKNEKTLSPVDKKTLNSLNNRIREKETALKRKDAEIKRLEEKIKFLQSL